MNGAALRATVMQVLDRWRCFEPSKGAHSQAAGRLTVGSLAFPNWCQLAAAQNFGWDEAEGVDGKFEVKYFESGPPEIEAGIGGSLQLMGLGAGPVINALAAGALPLWILGSVNEVTPLFGIVAQKGIDSMQGLREEGRGHARHQLPVLPGSGAG